MWWLYLGVIAGVSGTPLEMMKDYASQYPTSREVRALYKNHSKWEQSKVCNISNIVIDKKHKMVDDILKVKQFNRDPFYK